MNSPLDVRCSLITDGAEEVSWVESSDGLEGLDTQRRSSFAERMRKVAPNSDGEYGDGERGKRKEDRGEGEAAASISCSTAVVAEGQRRERVGPALPSPPLSLPDIVDGAAPSTADFPSPRCPSIRTPLSSAPITSISQSIQLESCRHLLSLLIVRLIAFHALPLAFQSLRSRSLFSLSPPFSHIVVGEGVFELFPCPPFSTVSSLCVLFAV